MTTLKPMAIVAAELGAKGESDDLRMLLLTIADEIADEKSAQWLRSRAGDLYPVPEKYGTRGWEWKWNTWYPEEPDIGIRVPAQLPESLFRKLLWDRKHPESYEHVQFGFVEAWERLFDALNEGGW